MGGSSSKQQKTNDIIQKENEPPKISPEEEKMMKKRAKISEEVLETERTYSNSLDKCVQAIIQPLKEKKQGVPDIPQPILRKMFSNLETVNDTHKKFLEELSALLSQEDAQFGPLFVTYANEFRIVYSAYVNDYNAAITLLSKTKKNNEDFDVFLETAAREAESQIIDSIMIMPVQRLPRYVLLLADLLKNTPKNHLDYKGTSKALETMEETTQFVNKEKDIAEKQIEILAIQNSLTRDSELLMNRERYLVTKGVVKVLKKDKDYQYFLFNDLLLFAGDKGITAMWSNRKYVEKDRCVLRNITIAKEDDDNNVVVIQTAQKRWILKFKTSSLYKEWLEIYKNTVTTAPEKKASRKKLSYSLDGNEKTKLIDKPETEGNCSCIIS